MLTQDIDSSFFLQSMTKQMMTMSEYQDVSLSVCNSVWMLAFVQGQDQLKHLIRVLKTNKQTTIYPRTFFPNRCI